MKIGFIGAGKVGFSLGKFFAQGNIPLTGFYSRRRESALEAALFTGTRAYDRLDDLIYDSDAIFLTVPDEKILPMYQFMREFRISEKIICHCSGAMTVKEAFPDIAVHGAYGYSIHPLFPISDKFNSYREMEGAFFCLEGDGPHIEAWKKLLTGLGVHVQIIPSDKKALYHAACAISSNLVCALVYEGIDLLKTCGFSDENAFMAISPLIRSNFKHILEDGPVKALTGPVERGDILTIEKHLACLSDGTVRELYRTASKKLTEIAALKNPDRDYRSLEELLE